METVISASGMVNFQHPAQGISDLKKACFSKLDVDMGKAFKPKPGQTREDVFSIFLTDNRILSALSYAILDRIKTDRISLFSLHSPVLPSDTKYYGLNEAQRLMAEETIHLSGESGCKNVIVPPVFAGIDKNELLLQNKKYYLSLAEKAKKNCVTILIENIYRNYNGQILRDVFADADQIAALIDELNMIVGYEMFGFCMNTVNCNLCGMDMHSFAVTLKKRIKAVIISDCDGQSETHLMPFTSVYHGTQTDWLSLIRGLREAEFNGGIILDISDTSAAFSPILRPHLISLAKSVADYFKWQLEIELLLKKYNKIVLFGAGNMCRNYMKCYGEKYPPLFTCDNNSKIWGTMFCGLEVKSPEELKRIPDDCAIFICNIYYREIEQQLRDMGITNPIEYFNDEYMPSFYFDRLNGV